MKRIAVIGHNRTIASVVASIEKHYKDIETVAIQFIDMDMKASAVEYLKAKMPQLDGLVFTSRKPYEIINEALGVSIPQIYIRHERSILLQALLEAKVTMGYDIGSFSCDSYDMEDLHEALVDVGMAPEHLKILTPGSYPDDESIMDELFLFHKDSFIQKGLSFCMTGITALYDRLRNEAIPAMLLRPTTEAVNMGIRQLLMQINALDSMESQIVVLSMEIDLPGEYNLIHDNEYQLMLEKSRVSQQVYKFAESIQAAVVETGIHSYILFSTRQILETVTDQLSSLPILVSVRDNTAHSLSVGVGYGDTAREARYNAAMGLNKALGKGGNQAYIVRRGVFSDPIYPQDAKVAVKTIADPLYKVISEKTGISINTIYRLHCIREQAKKDHFTSTELSEAFGNTRRSMNRILGKLERSGYAEVEGTRMMGEMGRPTRIIRLKF